MYTRSNLTFMIAEATMGVDLRSFESGAEGKYMHALKHISDVSFYRYGFILYYFNEENCRLHFYIIK